VSEGGLGVPAGHRRLKKKSELLLKFYSAVRMGDLDKVKSIIDQGKKKKKKFQLEIIFFFRNQLER
jgi:hypothetical protein